MAKKPLISIITVNLNNLVGLKKTMTSVFEQTWQDFEYIIIDGGSNDGSKEYIESQGERIQYWLSEKDSGIYNAMNKGIKVAKGEYLLFLNSGDHLFSKDVFEKNKHNFKFYDLIYFNITVIGIQTSELISYPEVLQISDLIYGTLCHQSTLIKRELFVKLSLYDENLQIVSDWKFFILALFKYNCSYSKIDDTLTTFYLGGISSNAGIVSRERLKVLQEYFPDYLRLIELEDFLKNIKISKTIRLLQKLGLLRFIDKIN